MSSELISWGIAGAAVALVLWRKFAPVKGCSDIEGEELRKLLKNEKDIKVIDVRTPAEYKYGHIPGALSRPLSELEKWAGEFERDQRLYLICASGMRSKAAARQLAKKGFANLFNIKGGMGSWQGPTK